MKLWMLTVTLTFISFHIDVTAKASVRTLYSRSSPVMLMITCLPTTNTLMGLFCKYVPLMSILLHKILPLGKVFSLRLHDTYLDSSKSEKNKQKTKHYSSNLRLFRKGDPEHTVASNCYCTLSTSRSCILGCFTIPLP